MHQKSVNRWVTIHKLVLNASAYIHITSMICEMKQIHLELKRYQVNTPNQHLNPTSKKKHGSKFQHSITEDNNNNNS